MADLWHPRAKHVEPESAPAGAYRVDCPYKFVLHTVEGENYSPSTASYYGNPYFPHFTVADSGLYQHYPIDVAARALYNEPGGVETNAARAIQAEVAWYAGRIGEMPAKTMANLADLTGWLVDGGVIPLTFAEFRGDGSYGVDAPQRFDGDAWYAFAGICGHQHVPENDHWDPGAFPVDQLLAAMGRTTEEDLLAALTADEQQEILAGVRKLRENTQWDNDVTDRVIGPFAPGDDAYSDAEGLARFILGVGASLKAIDERLARLESRGPAAGGAEGVLTVSGSLDLRRP